MKHREQPHCAAGRRTALGFLWLLLLPALGQKNLSAVSRPRTASGSQPNTLDPEPVIRPYLPALGSPPLRFQIPPPPPDLTSRPIAAASPIPAILAAIPAEEPPSPAQPKPAPVNSVFTAPTEIPVNTAKPATSPAKALSPSIIPDDVRPPVRPEDFLPYFLIPGSAKQPGDITILTPVPRGAAPTTPIPPSSATLTQSK